MTSYLLDHLELTGSIIGCAMKVHGALGPGFLESVYQNALVYELRRANLAVEVGRPLEVHYEGVVVGNFVVDMLIEEKVIIETKAARALNPAHEVQLVNYLTATGIEVGLLLNFGTPRLEFRRKSRIYKRGLGG